MSAKIRLYFCVSAFCILHLSAIAPGASADSSFLSAQGPAWWQARGAVDPNLTAHDYSPLTLGQLKWLAANASDEMNAYFGAGPGVTAVVGAFANTNNYYPANLGQLKYVAQPFYDRLYEFNLTNTFPAGMPGYYPWASAQSSNDYSPAVIGQAKYVFSFNSAVDSDADGLSDWREAELGTNPYNSDSDGDGLSDGWEVVHGYNPLAPGDVDPEAVRAELREQDRERIVFHWKLIYSTPLVFMNTPGSLADLNDMRNALNALSGKFYKVE